MPTVIALDISLSMRRQVICEQNEQLTRHQLAVHGINALLNYLQTNSKLEFVSLVNDKHYSVIFHQFNFL